MRPLPQLFINIKIFVRSGHPSNDENWYGNTLYMSGIWGAYWSERTATNSTYNIYNLMIDVARTVPSNTEALNRFWGHSLRCLAIE